MTHAASLSTTTTTTSTCTVSCAGAVVVDECAAGATPLIDG